MSVVPSRQFCPASSFIDSFHNSFSKFHSHGVPLSLSRYHSHLCTNRNSMTSNSINEQKPINSIPQNRVDSHLSSGWLDKWRDPYLGNRPKLPRSVLNYRTRISSGCGVFNLTAGSSCGSVVATAVGSGSGSTMDRIVEKLKKFGYMDDDINESDNGRERVIEKGSVEDIFYVEEGMLPDTRGGFSVDSPLGAKREFQADEEVRFPWEKPAIRMEGVEYSVKRKSRTFMAELTLPESELRRLWHLTLKTKQKLKIGGAGVAQAVVDEIQKRWKSAEIVRLKVEGAPALNMKRMHEILERKTGGLVIWRSGTSVSLYRGVSYEVPLEEQKRWALRRKGTLINVPLPPDQTRRNPAQDYSISHMNSAKERYHDSSNEKDSEREEVKYEEEIDKLLSDLGPRYTDWPGGDPLPIDADLLPSIIPGYQLPFRLLPYGVRRSLGQKEATALRRIARTLPPHFALGRSRHLEGLADAIVKLWETSSIAKVALKRGVQLTTSERMAEDIKRLTGGILLSRNKDFLVFYRGKDFLSSDVTKALLEREEMARALQDKEEEARMKASASVIQENASAFAIPNAGIEDPRAAGTLYETLDANAKWGKRVDDHEKEKMLREAELMRHADLVRKLERKLSFAERKVMKAEQVLSKVEMFLNPSDRQPDPESISDEERFMFRKLGLKMKAFLLLGRRGVFDGTVENMHLHWKYRELVKIIVKAKSFDDVKNTALSLEAESGGVLVSVDKVSKGYAIIVFRGKDYERPSSLRPKNLLSKRKALARSIELQRREALLKNMARLQQNADKLRHELKQMDIMRDPRNSELYDSLDAAYPTEDEDAEEEGDEAYFETYDDESEDESEFSP